jgi:hypothetical protein
VVGCARYPVVKEELVRQLKLEQKLLRGDGMYGMGTVYLSNGIDKFLCRTRDGEPVLLTSDKNTEMIITLKDSGDVVKMYLDTVFLSADDKLVGQRSRIVPSPREVSVADIDKIEIYAEFPRTEKARLK